MLVFFYINIVWFLAGIVNGVTSFGGNLFAVPLMTLVMEAREAIIFGCITGTAITMSIAVFHHRDLPKPEFLLACLGHAAGIPVGMIILEMAPAKLIFFAASAILLLFLVWQGVSGHMRKAFRAPLWAVVPVGVISGILFGSTSMGGPILAMYAVLRGWNKEITISMLSTMAAVSMLFLTILQWSNGLYTPQMLHDAAWAVPCAILGVLVSIPIIRRINPDIFRKLVLLMLAFSSAMLFARGWQA